MLIRQSRMVNRDDLYKLGMVDKERNIGFIVGISWRSRIKLTHL